MKDTDYWRAVWRRAYDNTPARMTKSTDNNNWYYGQQTNLARLLGLKKSSGWHNYIYNAMNYGYRPKDPERMRRLMIMASPLGPFTAENYLKRTGYWFLKNGKPRFYHVPKNKEV